MLLIFKLYIYQSREKEVLNLNGLIKNVTKVKKLERKIASVCKKKTIKFNIYLFIYFHFISKLFRFYYT